MLQLGKHSTFASPNQIVIMKFPHFLFFYLLFSFYSFSQVGIGTTTPRANLDISNSGNGGLLIPEYALTGNNDITTVINPQPLSPLVTGTLIYNSTNVGGINAISPGFVYWNGSLWTPIASAGTTSGWETTGNAGTDGGTTNFLGTTDARSLQIRTNNAERLRIGNFTTGASLTNLSGNTSFINTSTGSLTGYFGNTTLGVAGNTGQAVSVNGALTGLRTDQILNSASTVSGTITGFYNRIWGINNGGSLNTIEGSRNEFQFVGTAARPTIVNAFSNSLNTNAGGLIGAYRGLYTSFSNNAAITRFEGVRMDAPGTNTINYYGIFQDNLGTSTTRYFLYYNGDGTNTKKMVVSGTGRLGVGTDNPQATTHIVGNLRYEDGTQANGRVLTSDANGNATWQTPSGGGNGWSLTGNNSGNTDFLGTLNNNDLVFKTNNIEVARFLTNNSIRLGRSTNTSGNNATSIGFESAANADDAIALGRKATSSSARATALGFESVARADDATAVGRGATASSARALAVGHTAASSADDATAIGRGANSSSARALAVGYNSISSADDATALGKQATASSARSVAVGSNSEATADDSSAFGDGAKAGSPRAVAIGKNSNASNQNATALGNNAQAMGQNSTAIGNSAISSGDNSVALGNGATAGSNTIRLGNASITTIVGQVAYTFPSDGRFKYNITESVRGLDFINRLRPVQYKFDREGYSKFIGQEEISKNTNKIETGFIAQDVEKAAKEANYNFDGVQTPQGDKDTYSLAYSTFVVPLVKAVQEQQEQIEALKDEVKALKILKEDFAQMKALLATLQLENIQKNEIQANLTVE